MRPGRALPARGPPLLPRGEEVAVTASLGVATLEAHDDARALMRRADLAMYTAKSEGRDTVVGSADAAGPSTVPASHRTGEGAR